MNRTTVAKYLGIPALLTLGTFVVALQREPFGLEMFGSVVIAGYVFYAGPFLLWVIVAALGKFSNALWHAGLIAASIAMVTIAMLWLLPGDPSGLPIQWLLYWPLAVVLQFVLAVLTIAYQRVK